MEATPPTAPPPRAWARLRLWGRRLGVACGGLALVLAGAWATLALRFGGTHGGGGARVVWPVLFVAAAFAALVAAVVVWFSLLRPSNDGNWTPESAELGWVDIQGDRAQVHRVRHFDYRTAEDFTPHWEDRTYDLAQIRSVDLMLSYWGSDALAHAMISFGFADGRRLAVSVESRREKGEPYSPLRGAFRQYEKIFIFADERDVVRLRTTFRGEQVYLYRTTATPAQARRIFESYAAAADALKTHPAFYNSLTGNCASAIVTRVKEAGLPAEVTWETVFGGYAAHYMYTHGSVDTRLSFAALKARSGINAAADAAGNAEDFSARIRAGLPNPAGE